MLTDNFLEPHAALSDADAGDAGRPFPTDDATALDLLALDAIADTDSPEETDGAAHAPAADEAEEAGPDTVSVTIGSGVELDSTITLHLPVDAPPVDIAAPSSATAALEDSGHVDNLLSAFQNPDAAPELEAALSAFAPPAPPSDSLFEPGVQDLPDMSVTLGLDASFAITMPALTLVSAEADAGSSLTLDDVLPQPPATGDATLVTDDVLEADGWSMVDAAATDDLALQDDLLTGEAR